MANQNEWYNLLESARKLSANDLDISNDLLRIVEELIDISSKESVPLEDMEVILKSIVENAMSLTESSKDINSIITRIVDL